MEAIPGYARVYAALVAHGALTPVGCRVTTRVLAAQAHIAHRNAQKHLAEMEARGLLTTDRPKPGAGQVATRRLHGAFDSE